MHGVEIRWLEPGRFVPQNAEDVPGSEFSIPASVVVEAIGTGFSPEALAMLSGLVSDGGRPRADDRTMRLSDARVFGGGDLVAPGKTVAASVRDGKRAAEAIAEAFPLRKAAAAPKVARPSLEIDFCGVRCPNPFFLSSSPVGNTAEMISRAFDAGWGGAVYKTLNLETDFEVIDPTPRLNALKNGDARFIGLQNMEQISERPLADNLEDIAWLKKHYPDRVLVASIMGYSDEGWVELATRSEAAGADMLELNVSCPQMACEGAGHRVGQDNDLLERYSRVVKEHVSIPVMVKLTPNVTDMLPSALAVQRGGADAVATINTVRSISEIDLETFSPMPSIQGRGSISGYSGTAVKPIALRFVAELGQSTQVDLAGLRDRRHRDVARRRHVPAPRRDEPAGDDGRDALRVPHRRIHAGRAGGLPRDARVRVGHAAGGEEPEVHRRSCRTPPDRPRGRQGGPREVHRLRRCVTWSATTAPIRPWGSTRSRARPRSTRSAAWAVCSAVMCARCGTASAPGWWTLP